MVYMAHASFALPTPTLGSAPGRGPKARRGPKALNMQEYAHIAPNATPFTCILLPFTHGPEELRSIVYRHPVPQGDAVC